MKDEKVLRIVLTAILASLVMVATMFLKVPTPTGYVHLGDGVIFAAALALGPWPAASAGALGSALADLFAGYGVWAPWTFVIKGGAGLIVGYLGYNRKKSFQLASAFAASLWIIAGYAVGTAFIYSPEAVIGEVLGNLVQTGSGILVGLYLGPVLHKAVSRNM